MRHDFERREHIHPHVVQATGKTSGTTVLGCSGAAEYQPSKALYFLCTQQLGCTAGWPIKAHQWLFSANNSRHWHTSTPKKSVLYTGFVVEDSKQINDYHEGLAFSSAPEGIIHQPPVGESGAERTEKCQWIHSPAPAVPAIISTSTEQHIPGVESYRVLSGTEQPRPPAEKLPRTITARRHRTHGEL